MSLPPETDELDSFPGGNEPCSQIPPPPSVVDTRPLPLRVISFGAKLALFLAIATSVLGFGIPGLVFVLPTPFEISSAAVAPSTEAVGDAEAAANLSTPAPSEVAGMLPAPEEPDPIVQPWDDEALIAGAAAVRKHAADVVPTPSVPGRPLQVRSYRVQPGDTLLALAVEFGITPETILWANDLGNGDLLRIGEDLTIPPVSGIVHHVQKGDTLTAIADMYGADAGDVRAANGLDGKEVTEGQLLIVPGGVKRTTAPIEGLPKKPSTEDLAGAPHYTVLAGDNLVSIADAFGVRPSIIQVTNNLLDPDALRVGQDLVIPGGKRTSAPPQVAVAPTALPQPTVAPTATAVATTPVAPVSPAGDRYVVKAGDTLFSIARALGIQMQALADANGLADPSKLRVGQSLVVPPGTQTAAAARTTTPAAAPTRAATQAPAPTPVPATATARPAQPLPSAAPAKPAQTAVPAPLTKPTGNPANGQRIATIAQKYIGFRYLWGGHTPTGFDCSGFTWYVYREAGFNIPQHDLPGQLNAGPRVPREQLLPGDLVFFQNTYMPGLSHVGIYLGGGRFINAETEAVGVQVRSLTDPFWASRFYGASRPY